MDGPPPQEEDFTTLPISERLAHKNWKARVSGYESLIKTFGATASDTDPAFKPYINNPDLLKKIVTDANAVAQEKGVECIVALVKFAGETAAKTREMVLPALVDKCLGSTRAGTKNQAVEAVLQYVEVENGGGGIVNDLLVGLNAKQPKAVSGCILALKEIIRVFGAQTVPSPPILKVLPKIFAHSDKTVRAEGTNLTVALYQYIGPGIEPWLADLKPVQVKELKDAFENLEKEGKGHKTLKPERLTRAQGREVATNTEDTVGEAEGPEDMALPDPRAFAEVTDIVAKLSPSLQTNLKSSKWKERKEALDDLSTLLVNTPRIKDAAELAELARSLATCIAKDANINCVMVAAKCLEDLAKGMMSSFAKYRETVVPLMLERMKERKANVTDAIGTALDAIFATTTLNDILPDLDASLKSKNPQVKEGALKFLGRCIASATSPIQPGQVKPLAETLAALLEDGFEGARTEAATCFGTLMKMVGERPLNAVVDTMADMRKAKVKEAFEKATVKCKVGGAPPPRATGPPPVKKPGGPSVSKPPAQEDEAPPVPKKTSAPPKPAPKPAPKKSSATAAPPAKKPATANAAPKAAGKPSGSAAAANLDVVKYKHSPEDAEALAADLVPGSILSDLGDANWKTRLAALDELSAWLEEEMQSLDAEVLVRAMAKKGWSDKNFQVSAKIYGILTLLSQQCPSFGRSCIAICISHLTEKLGDLKLKKPAGDTLLAFAEKTSLQFVLGQAYDPLSKQKAPKVLGDAITWINAALTDFGVVGLSLRGLIDFLKVALENSNAAVRTSATKTLVTVKLFAGSSIKDLLEGLNPQLLNTITSEFDKVEGQPAPEPCRTSIDLVNMGPESSKDIKGGGADPLDELFPRVEIDTLLKGTTILADAKSDAWKTKKEALEGLQAILDQGNNKRLKPSMGEIGQILKTRVTDTNKAVQTLALDLVARIATGMGKSFERHSRLFAHPVSTVLSDQKAPIRTAALQTLTAMGAACEGLDSMIPGFTTALEATNPLQKATLLQWLVEWFKDHDATSSLDLKSWAPILVSSLDDRNSDVRKAAQAFLPTLVHHAGFDFVMHQSNSLKPASRASAVPLIQAARPSVIETTSLKPVAAAAAKAPAVSPEPPVSPIADAPVEAKAANKLSGVRRKIPLGTSRPESRAENVDISNKPTSSGLKKTIAPTSALRPPASITPVNPALPFLTMNMEPKKTRLMKDAGRWVNEGGPTRKDLADLLQSQMEPHASKDLVARLFSHDHNAVNDYVNGLTTLADFYTGALDADENIEKLCLANLDLPLKYISIKAHEPQPNLISKCIDVIEAVLAFLRHINYQLLDNEATCFIPTIVYKLGDAREQIRVRVQQIIRGLPNVYAYSRVFQLLLEHGIKAKVAKTRQGTLDELSAILKKSGMGACEPSKAFPAIATLISDKDPSVRKAALGTLSEGYSLVGEKVWSLVGHLSAKDKTQLEERLRRVPGPSSQGKAEPTTSAAPSIARLTANIPRPASPSVAAVSRLARPASPAIPVRSASPAFAQNRPESPSRSSTIPPVASAIPTSPGKARPRSLLPSRLGRPRTNIVQPSTHAPLREEAQIIQVKYTEEAALPSSPKIAHTPFDDRQLRTGDMRVDQPDDITLTISSILSSDPARSVDALKKVQKILSVGPENGPSSPQYRELAEHTEGLIETITLQMAHIFEHPNDLILDDNFRLAKHLIQTLNNFCDHSFLAESLTVDILTALLEELTLRLLETDDSPMKKVKDLSRFINMIILRLFATGRRMSIFKALFSLLLQIVKPFPSNGVLPDSKEAKVAELVLKCVWKLARNIPQDLSEAQLDPVELFPAIEHFLQSVPPNEWRARATNKVPCGDMPLRTIKVIIQHIVAHHGDDVYELLSASFDDPSATIVYPYVYRILNSGNRASNDGVASRRNGSGTESHTPRSPGSSRPLSPQETASSVHSNNRPPSHRTTSPSSSSANGHGHYSPNAEEPDPDAQLLVIIGHISSETTGALHKEGITELHHFLKAYPNKKPRVEKLLESTGAAFRKYINRALATRAAEDQERNVAVADTLSKLEYNSETNPNSPTMTNGSGGMGSPAPTRTTISEGSDQQQKLSRLHDIFQYRSSTQSAGSSQGRTTPSGLRTS